MDLLQKYLFVPLDIFREIQHNKNMRIENRLEAWLAFLCMDEPEAVISVTEKYSDFKAMYEQVYDICRNIEEVMGMFSEELRIMDRNTVQLMIDEMQNEIDQKSELLSQQNEQLNQKDKQLTHTAQQLKAEQQAGIINIIELCQELNTPSETAVQKLMQKCFLSEDEARQYMAIYWQES